MTAQTDARHPDHYPKLMIPRVCDARLRCEAVSASARGLHGVCREARGRRALPRGFGLAEAIDVRAIDRRLLAEQPADFRFELRSARWRRPLRHHVRASSRPPRVRPGARLPAREALEGRPL